MKFKLISIGDRLPTQNHFHHPLDTIIFYDKNKVKFLFKKQKILDETKESFLDKGFTHWLEEIH